MDTLLQAPHTSDTAMASASLQSSTESRWSLAFVGILAYLIVDYTRLPAMYPILQVLHLGKVVVIVSLLGLMVAPHQRLSLPGEIRWIHALLVAVPIVGLVSAIFTRYDEKTWGALRDAAVYFLIAFLIGRILNTSWRTRIFFWTFLLLNLKLAQFVIRSYYYERGQGITEIVLAKGVGAGSTGFFSDSADFGVAMCVAWAITIPMLFANLRKLSRWFVFGSSLTFLAAILLCGSRGALVGAAAISMAALVRAPRKLVPLTMAIFLASGVLFFLPQANMARVHSAINWQSDPNAQSRIAFWMAGLEMLRDHPLVGIGVGNFSTAYAKDYVNPAITTKAMACHSIYIQALSELGLSGTILLVILCWLVFRLNSRTRRRALGFSTVGRRSYEYCLALGIDLALVGYLVSGAFLSVLFYPMLWTLTGLSIGLSTACTRIQDLTGTSPQEFTASTNSS